MICTDNRNSDYHIRRLGLERLVARMGEREMHAEFWWGNLKERDHLEDLDVGGKIILKFA